MTLAPRVVIVHRRTELEELLGRHGTRGAAEHFLRTRGRTLGQVQERHDAVGAALSTVTAAIPADWRRGRVERADLDRFLFAPEDLVVAVGQDGLVANVAKYLDGQPVLGVNPDAGVNPGILVPLTARDFGPAAALAATGAAAIERRTMVSARSDDGQHLLALNEIFVGHPTHQSARYRITPPQARAERQSSSGVIASTGTGATGWCASVAGERHTEIALPRPTDPALVWFVREAWASPATATSQTEGRLDAEQVLTITAESDTLVVFGDGIESDHLTLSWGQELTLSVAQTVLHLVRAPGRS